MLASLIRSALTLALALVLTLALAQVALAGPTEDGLTAAVARDLPRTLKLLERAVRISSATGDRAGIRRVGQLFARELAGLGFTTRWDGVHLIAERPGTRGKRVLLIGHLDTVVPSSRWRRDGALAYGAGTADMKGGDVIIIGALRALARTGALGGTQIIIVFTGDEEQPARPTDVSRAALVAAARRSDAALAFEVGVGTTGTIARRGTSTWRLEVTSPSGHSSGIFKGELGSGAIFAAADILSRFRAEMHEPYLTFSPGLIAGGAEAQLEGARASAGGKTNVVAARVLVDGDLRFISTEQREHAKTTMRAIAAAAPAPSRAEITFDDGYPPMPPTDGNRALLGVLDEASRDLGLGAITALDPGERGAGDASFVAPYLDVLDGLGAKGGGTHTADEYLELDSLPDQIRRAALVIQRLTRSGL